MKILKNLTSRLGYIISCLYYLRSSIIKNSYPYKLIGEKIIPSKNDILILFKILGKTDIFEIELKKILNNTKHLERFSPIDALKIGSLALNDIIIKLPENERKNKFNKIKCYMLNSTHDVHNITVEDENIDLDSQFCKNDSFINLFHYLDSISLTNAYPCKLVGSKSHLEMNNTIIIYTIFGKRDGHEKSLKDIINNSDILAKFHPTDAIKFGFIYTGEKLFTKQERQEKYSRLNKDLRKPS